MRTDERVDGHTVKKRQTEGRKDGRTDGQRTDLRKDG